MYANLPELLLLLALLLVVVLWPLVRLVLIALGVGALTVVTIAMAGYGFLEMLAR